MIFAIEISGKDPRNMCDVRDKIDCDVCGKEASKTCPYAQMFALREITANSGANLRTKDGKTTRVQRLFGLL